MLAVLIFTQDEVARKYGWDDVNMGKYPGGPATWMPSGCMHPMQRKVPV